jgi:hypothetical protein
MVVLVDRDGARVPVDRRGTAVNHTFGLRLAGGHQHVEGPADVGCIVVARVRRRGDDVPGGEVEHEAVCRNELVDECLVRDRALNELGARRDRLRLTREEVVEDCHACTSFHELARQDATDEAGSARHENPSSAE